MFSDTVTITINAIAKVLTKVKEQNGQSEYRLKEADGLHQLFIRQSTRTDKTRNVLVERHNVEFVQTVYGIATAPNMVRKVYQVIENDEKALTVDTKNHVMGSLAFFTAGNVDKILNLEV